LASSSSPGPRLTTGKLPPDLLRRIVLGRLGVRRPETVVHAALGVDAAAIDLGGWTCVLKTDPITTATTAAGRLAVLVACNDLAAMGAEPLGVLPTLLFPERVTPSAIEALVEQIDGAARELNVEVLGGHTEVAPGLTAPLVVMASVGRVRPGRIVTTAGARPGDDLVLTKAAALEGTTILAEDFAEQLSPMVAPALLEEARGYRTELSVVPEGLAAAEQGATAMHDPTEGGVVGALWELAEASGTGFRVEERLIPVRPATRAVCAALGADPLRLIASGALLIACADGAAMARHLAGLNIRATVVGRVTDAARELVRADGRVTEVTTVGRDELYRLLESTAR
jgi:hydrogenase expression/formation protein HypE